MKRRITVLVTLEGDDDGLPIQAILAIAQDETEKQLRRSFGKCFVSAVASP